MTPGLPTRQVKALLLDFNGTLSNDEGLLYEIYAAMFSARGRPLDRATYVASLAGRSDDEIFHSWLGSGADVTALTAERVDRYVDAVSDGGTISEPTRAAVAFAAAHVLIGIVTSARRDEVLTVVRAARLDRFVSTYVCVEDVVEPKPHPEPYAAACLHLAVLPAQALAVEDTDVGLVAAHAAGVRCAALTTTMAADRLAAADLLLPSFDCDAVERLLAL
jgi:HAD superfamily hydrolase (TIGR01509 family)